MTPTKKLLRVAPTGLIFGLEDVPRPFDLILLGFLHFILIAPNLAIILLIARAAGAEPNEIATMISFSMIVLAITTVLQGYEKIGSGYFIPSCNSAIYVSASLAAAAGGLPLVFGMTVVAGLIQIFFAEVLMRMRRFFPPEIIALAIIVVAIELGAVGLNRIAAAGGAGLVIGGATFFLAVFLGVHGRGTLRLYSALIGMAAGYVISIFTGFVDPAVFWKVSEKALFAIPDLPSVQLQFDFDLIIPFTLAAIAASLKTMGAVVLCDKICDASWVRPDMDRVRRGIMVDGLATAFSGLIGAAGTNASTSNVGVSHATGATCRVLRFSVAGWMLLFALTPKFTYFFVTMPDPVVGGALVFSACLVMVNGLQLLGSVQMDMRRAGVLALPLILAIAVVAKAPIFELAPAPLGAMFASALSVSIVAALFANFFLSFGTSRRVDFSSLPAATIHEHIARVEHKCDAWNVAQNVKARVMLTLRELLDDRSAALRLQFDGCTLRLEIKRHARAGANASDALPETFFFQHVTDRFSHRKGRGGTEVLSLYFEQ